MTDRSDAGSITLSRLPTGRMKGAIAFVLKGYPRLSETFIAQEIHALEEAGLDVRIVSLRHPTDRRVHRVHEEIRAPVMYLPEYLHHEPARVRRGWRLMRGSPGYRRARALWWADLRRDRTRNRVRRFGQALVLAAELPDDVVHIHAHFLHTPASVARYAAWMTGRSWTFSAHAKDIWTSPEWEKREKLDDCAWGVTCTAANLAHLRSLAAHPQRIELAYHGLDLVRFGAASRRPASRDGGAVGDPVVILSVGRAVAKKGFDLLLDALARLPGDLHWRFEHVGGGPQHRALDARARRLGISERVRWHGALDQEAVLALYRRADLFALACRITADGDRDGLPNVLVEAQSQGLACVSTRVSAIPELIEAGRTGLLVAEADVAALADAIARLVREPALRQRLGEAGERRVREHFDLAAAIGPLARRLGAL